MLHAYIKQTAPRQLSLPRRGACWQRPGWKSSSSRTLFLCLLSSKLNVVETLAVPSLTKVQVEFVIWGRLVSQKAVAECLENTDNIQTTHGGDGELLSIMAHSSLSYFIPQRGKLDQHRSPGLFVPTPLCQKEGFLNCSCCSSWRGDGREEGDPLSGISSHISFSAIGIPQVVRGEVVLFQIKFSFED